MVQLLISKTQQQQIEWRRGRVLELSSQGFSQSDIATVLQVDKSIISRDVAYLRHQAQENLQKHIHETIPEEYQKAMVSIDQILKMCWSIVSKTADEKTRLQALALINECTRHRVDLSTSGVVITDAIKYVNAKMDHLNNQEKEILQDIKQENDTKKGEEETTTTNGVF
jgi:predicted transcriptional regulator